MSRSILQSMARIRPALARGVVTCALVALPVGAAAITAQARTAGATSAIRNQAALRYAVRFEGVGAEGVDDIWRGRLGGGTSGEITLRVEYRGAPMGVAEPKWPVRVMAFVAADDPSKSFLAESEGTLDWTAGAMQLEGRVSAGWMKGASVEQTLRLDRAQLDGAGSLRLEVVTASR